MLTLAKTFLLGRERMTCSKGPKVRLEPWAEPSTRGAHSIQNLMAIHVVVARERKDISSGGTPTAAHLANEVI